jgi:hypothetical protein
MNRIARAHGTALLSGLLFLLQLVVGLAVASCTQRAPVQPTLEVTPAVASLVTGQTMELEVTRRFPSGPVELVSDRVTYTSSSRNVASISERGVITAGAEAGSILVRIYDPASDAVATVNVTVALPRIESIDVAPWPAVDMRPGTTRRFSATARLNNGVIRDVTSEVIWASSDEDVATVGRSPPDFGVVTGLAEGDSTISATDSDSSVQGRTIVFVRGATVHLRAIRVAPNPADVEPGQTLQLQATGVLSDGSERDVTTEVIWTSSHESVAAVTPAGLAAGINSGYTTISATARTAPPAVDGGAPPEPIRGSAELRVP